jgi:hypothetical protein
MADIYLPLIESSEDYEAFQRIMKDDLTDPFDVWANNLDQESLDLTRASSGGHQVIRVKVNSDGFTEHCRATGQKPTEEALRAYAFKIGSKRERN